MEMIKPMLAGAIMVSAWAIAVFFLRFWRKSSDRLFAFFAAAFLLLGIERVTIEAFRTRYSEPIAGQVRPDTAANGITEGHAFVYLIRLGAFLLIIFAIVDKNRRAKTS